MLSVLENKTITSPQVNLMLVCEYLDQANERHNCIHAGFSQLKDELRAVEEELNLRKLLKAPWQHVNYLVHEYEDDDSHHSPRTLLSWSTLIEKMDNFHMRDKSVVADRVLLNNNEIPLLELLRPEEAFSMNLTCNNLICDFGNNIGATFISLYASESHLVCSITIGTELQANGTLVGGKTDAGEWISYTELETTWDSDTTAGNLVPSEACLMPQLSKASSRVARAPNR
ncbi:hypothetical protein CYMTET_42434 [Cymbomonas tetramitiformis]|uniref:Uncharacterized protein n=1 Tax=Cymbomonas tetramitiformis TaxID=36881 RepID=A0AAE0C432_9CHLO|nr:hypothetical protein CYMTET_42434 [Cymbomonas tetramitiformis]